MPDLVPDLVSPFALLPGAALVLDPEVETSREERFADISDAFASLAAETGSKRPGLAPRRAVSRRGRLVGCLPGPAPSSGSPTPRRRRRADRPPRLEDLTTILRERVKAGGRVGISGPAGPRRTLLRMLARRPGVSPTPVEGWLALRNSAPGPIGLLPGPLDEGFADPEADTLVIAPADLLGPSAVGGSSGAEAVPFTATLAPGRCGDPHGARHGRAAGHRNDRGE